MCVTQCKKCRLSVVRKVCERECYFVTEQIRMSETELQATLDALPTESIDAHTGALDQMNALELCELFNRRDANVAEVVRRQLPHIANAVPHCSVRTTSSHKSVYS